MKCINGILCNNGVRLDRCRSSLLSKVTTKTTMDRCTEFINKVRESRFIIIRNRQINKLNRLAGNRDRGSGTNAQSIGKGHKWVINLFNTPLTKSQDSFLCPKISPNLQYITAIKTACQKLNNQNADELRAGINGLPRKLHAPRPNLNKEESKALMEFKKGQGYDNLNCR